MSYPARLILAITVATSPGLFAEPTARAEDDLPVNLRVVLDNTEPLRFSRGGRLPLYVLPISGTLAGVSDARTEEVLRDLDARGIGYTIDWRPGTFEKTLAEGLRIGAIQQRLGLEVAVNANACLYSFFDGTDKSLHVDDSGKHFAESSFGGKLGCPFALQYRIPIIQERVTSFLRAYLKAAIAVDFIFADWEVDGPIEWNDAWASSRRCRVCQREIPQIDDFRQFQKRLREIRAEMQRVTFGDNVTAIFPQALVGNYGVYPHDGYRYWYDYFEHFADGVPFRQDQKARYREWFHEFEQTGYTFAMPVVYTWYPTFDWYDFKDYDYRWFYNMLLVGSNAGRHTAPATPIISFVHWTTTAPPEDADPQVRQFSEEKYQELLWHLLLRGHDTFFLWCVPKELPQEIRLVHEVYAAALQYRGFLDRGTPVTWDVPKRAGSVVSGLRLGDRVLVRRTDFANSGGDKISVPIPGAGEISVSHVAGNQIVDVRHRSVTHGFLPTDGGAKFPIGFYELPAQDADLRRMAQSGINLVRCSSRQDLDRAQAAGVSAWVPLGVQQGATDALRKRVTSLADHPALAVWEGPDEIVWMFTAYSGLAKTAGFTRADWQNQIPKAVAHARLQADKILPAMRDGIRLVQELDRHQRPFWINEAADSDLAYVRQYVDGIGVTGCDYYPVRADKTDLTGIGRLVERWKLVGRSKPVWMVLQGFSWHTVKPGRDRRYPSFAESRFMAYDAIVHGAQGLMYWGSHGIDDPDFRTSLYALTTEVAALNPYLVAPEHGSVRIGLVADVSDPPAGSVWAALRQVAGDWLLILVNEDPYRHLGVDVTGLDAIENRRLNLLYGDEILAVNRGGIVTRLQGHQVKVFATDRTLAAASRQGRDYANPQASR